MRYPTIPCPGCEIPNDGQFNPGDPTDVPTDGDLSICIYCGHLAVFTGQDDTIGLRPITDEERESALTDPTVVEIIRHVERMKF